MRACVLCGAMHRLWEKGPAGSWVFQAWPHGVWRSLSVTSSGPGPPCAVAWQAGGMALAAGTRPGHPVFLWRPWATLLGEEVEIGAFDSAPADPLQTTPGGLWLASPGGG